MEKPRRKQLRLANWDYSTNACYHVTICTKDRKPTFGYVVRCDNMETPCFVKLTPLGKCCEESIAVSSSSNASVSIENYVVMPNHVHVLVWIKHDELHPVSLESFVRYLKSSVTKAAHAKGLDGPPIWQKGYYERIIRGDEDFFSVWEYIDNNPAKWDTDPYCC